MSTPKNIKAAADALRAASESRARIADALTSLEYYLEGGAILRRDDSRVSVLDLASESVRALGMPVAA